MDKGKTSEELALLSPLSDERKEAALADETLEAVDGGYLYADGKFLSPLSKSYAFDQPVMESGRACDDKGKESLETGMIHYAIPH